jgi:hypothetical protein
VERLRRWHATPGVPVEDAVSIAFALHRALDGRGERDEAWAALARGRALRRSTVRYDVAEDEALMRAVARRWPDPAPSERASPEGAQVPVFIVGLHRTGTTLLEQQLAAHRGVAIAGETLTLTALLSEAVDHHVRGALDAVALERMDRVDPTALGEAWRRIHRARFPEATHVVEKLPQNFLLVGLIRRALPEARILHLARAPMDACWSNLRERFGRGTAPYSDDVVELARFYAAYRTLMDHWREREGDAIHDVEYEALVREPIAIVEAVCRFCALDPAKRTTSITASRTASAAQVREPIHTRSIGRWAAYASQLAPLRDELRDRGIVDA